MPTEKQIQGRIQLKHDTQTNWEKATNFIPKAGEIIIYDKDSNYNYQRLKIGDGVTNVNLLPFLDDNLREEFDLYYTKAQIDAMEFITVADIDTICGTTIQVASDEGVVF